MSPKILVPELLGLVRDSLVVLCHGVYDVLSLAHYRHLEWAKSQGDLLVVSVTGDDYVNKGYDRPHHNELYRAEQLTHLFCVDYVTLCHSESALPILRILKPDIYVKGRDTLTNPKPGFDDERDFVASYGGEVRFSPAYHENHTTDMLHAKRKHRSQQDETDVAPGPGESVDPGWEDSADNS